MHSSSETMIIIMRRKISKLTHFPLILSRRSLINAEGLVKQELTLKTLILLSIALMRALLLIIM